MRRTGRAAMRSADRLSCGKAAGVCLAAAFVLLAGAAHSQQAPVQITTQPPAQAQDQAALQPKITPPVEPNRPGFIDSFGQWIENSVGNWNSNLKGAADVAKDAAGAANDAARDAGSVVTDTAGAGARIPATRGSAQRTPCPGAPKRAAPRPAAPPAGCQAAAFSSGRHGRVPTLQRRHAGRAQPAGQPAAGLRDRELRHPLALPVAIKIRVIARRAPISGLPEIGNY